MIEKFCNELAAFSFASDDITVDLYELTDLLEGEESLSAVYSPIFRFLENYPEANILALEPLVYLLERSYPEYVDHLIESLSSKPTAVTVNLLARVLNMKVPQDKKSDYKEILQSIAADKSVDKLAAQEAADYFKHKNTEAS